MPSWPRVSVNKGPSDTCNCYNIVAARDKIHGFQTGSEVKFTVGRFLPSYVELAIHLEMEAVLQSYCSRGLSEHATPVVYSLLMIVHLLAFQ